MKKIIAEKSETLKHEKVPMLYVWKEGDKIKFHSTRDIDNFALYGFLKTYINFLEDELTINMANSNNNFPKKE